LIKGIEPPFDPDILSYRGRIRGRGPPLNKGEGVCQTDKGGR